MENKDGIKKFTNGEKTFGGVVAIIAVILGIFAMVEPMGQRMDFIERQVENVIEAMSLDNERERADLIELGEMRQKFVEIETQFDAYKHRISIIEDWYSWWVKNVPAMDATQSERLKVLERDYFKRNNK